MQSTLESGIDANLADVRVHTNAEANRLSHSLDAKAFTTGNDIFFGQGQYNPASSEGLHLLAHEATHTVQQSRGSVDGISWGTGVNVSEPGDRFEQAAEASAQHVMNQVHPANHSNQHATQVVQRELSTEWVTCCGSNISECHALTTTRYAP